jgi:hypothetical protein
MKWAYYALDDENNVLTGATWASKDGSRTGSFWSGITAKPADPRNTSALKYFVKDATANYSDVFALDITVPEETKHIMVRFCPLNKYNENATDAGYGYADFVVPLDTIKAVAAASPTDAFNFQWRTRAQPWVNTNASSLVTLSNLTASTTTVMMVVLALLVLGSFLVLAGWTFREGWPSTWNLALWNPTKKLTGAEYKTGGPSVVPGVRSLGSM